MGMRKIASLTVALCMAAGAAAQDTLLSYRLNLVKHPVTKKYGYAFKEQNINSPIRGLTKTAVNMFGKNASMLIGKDDAENIDWAVPPQYDKAARKYSENLAAVEVGGKVGFIDLRNRFVIEPVYEPMDSYEGFSNGVAAVRKDSLWGYIDKEGRTVIPFEYEDADPFEEELVAAVKKDGRWGAIDITGAVVVPFGSKTKMALKTVPVSNKEWRAAKKEAREKRANGAYDEALGRLHEASRRVNGRIAEGTMQRLEYHSIGGADSTGVADQYGRCIVPAGFDKVTYDSDDRVYIVEKDGRKGAYLYNGTRLIRPCFDTMALFEGGRSQVTASGVEGWIDTDGNLSENLLADMARKGIATEETSKAEARRIYERILDINPEYATAYNNIALLDIANRDYNKGMRKLKLANELAPEDTTIAKNLKWAKESRKERRSERWMAGLSIASAIIGVASTTYSTYSAIKGGGGTPSTGGGTYTTDTGSDYSGGSGGGNGKAGAASKKCMTCLGSGTCTGRGMSSKYHCHGSGKCGYCEGGTTGMGPSETICSACHGRDVCKYCKGTGKCEDCHGTGTR